MARSGDGSLQRRWRVSIRQRPHTLRAVRFPHAAVRSLREPSKADRARRTQEAHATARQAPGALLGHGPYRAGAVSVQRVRGARWIACGFGRCAPAPAIESRKTGGGAHPRTPLRVYRHRSDSARREPVGAPEVTQAAPVPPADAAEAVADPEPLARLGKQHSDAGRRAALAGRRLEPLELQTVEAEQAGGTAEPKRSVVGLRERFDLRRSTVSRRPSRVVQLAQRQ